jgi:hypothetical protein
MEYRVTDANDIDMLMDVRLSMLRIVKEVIHLQTEWT